MKQASLCSSMVHGGGKRRVEGMGTVVGLHMFCRDAISWRSKEKAPALGKPGLNGRKAGHGVSGDAFGPNSC